MNGQLKILFISRASLFRVKGGDTVQVIKTAEALKKTGVTVDVKLCDEKQINYSGYNLIHFFNIRHPADMIVHIKKSKLPYLISTIYVDYANPVIKKTKGIRDWVFTFLSSDAQEYIKTMGKSILQGEKIMSRNYIWRGHKRSVRWVLKNAAELLPNSESEYSRLLASYGIKKKYSVIPNGADNKIFNYNGENIRKKDINMVLCVARIELRKNQLNLVKALNDSPFELYLIGDPAPNHIGYYNECKKISRSNVHFIRAMPQQELVEYYKKARVHILPSWFETTGLSSLEALFCGCNIVVTKYGDTKDYFDPKHCFFCDPESVASIREAVEKAAAHKADTQYIDGVMDKCNWQQAAEKTWMAYQQVILNNKQ
jgi:glycosyltransferase involved in cell wall biosynthesis